MVFQHISSHLPVTVFPVNPLIKVFSLKPSPLFTLSHYKHHQYKGITRGKKVVGEETESKAEKKMENLIFKLEKLQRALRLLYAINFLNCSKSFQVGNTSIPGFLLGCFLMYNFYLKLLHNQKINKKIYKRKIEKGRRSNKRYWK